MSTILLLMDFVDISLNILLSSEWGAGVLDFKKISLASHDQIPDFINCGFE